MLEEILVDLMFVSHQSLLESVEYSLNILDEVVFGLPQNFPLV